MFSIWYGAGFRRAQNMGAQPRYSDRPRQQPLADDELSQISPQAVVRECGTDANAEQRVKRAQTTAEGLLPAEEPQTITDFESGPFLARFI